MLELCGMKKTSEKNKVKKGNHTFKEFRLKLDVRTIFIVGFIGFFFFTLFGPMLADPGSGKEELSLTKVIQDIREQKVNKVIIEDNRVTAEYKNEESYTTYKEDADSFRGILTDEGIPLENVIIESKDSTLTVEIFRFLGNIVPAILLFGFFFFIFRQAKGSQNSVFSFGNSKAKRFNKEQSKITFKDVAGV